MSIQDLTEEKMDKIALVQYPKDTEKDLDGDWYDKNEYNRAAFIDGLKMAKFIDAM